MPIRIETSTSERQPLGPRLVPQDRGQSSAGFRNGLSKMPFRILRHVFKEGKFPDSLANEAIYVNV